MSRIIFLFGSRRRPADEKITKIPANLDLTPRGAPKPGEGSYLDEKDTELIKVMQRAMVP
ncbi:MAG: hypothetical protein WC334_03255 [Kiritimatiellales bacterium]